MGFGQVGLTAYAWLRLNAKITGLLSSILAYSFLASALLNSFVSTGSRLEMTITLLLFFLPRTLGGTTNSSPDKRLDIKKIWRFVSYTSVILVLIVIALAILQGRVTGTDPQIILFAVQRVYFDQAINDIISNNDAIKLFFIQLSYVGVPINFLVYYLHQYNWNNPITQNGFVNFSVWYLAVSKFIPGFSDTAFAEANLALRAPLEQSGFYANIWGTLARETLVDFGANGTLIFFALLGFVSNAFRLRYALEPSSKLAIAIVFLRLQLLWSGFHSLLPHRTLGFGIFAIFLLLVFDFVFKTKKHF